MPGGRVVNREVGCAVNRSVGAVHPPITISADRFIRARPSLD